VFDRLRHLKPRSDKAIEEGNTPELLDSEKKKRRREAAKGEGQQKNRHIYIGERNLVFSK